MRAGSSKRMKHRGAMRARACLPWLCGLSLLAGCNVPIAIGLDESDANHAVVALEKNGVAADKERDPESEGHWRISVARDDASSAAGIRKGSTAPRKSAMIRSSVR